MYTESFVVICPCFRIIIIKLNDLIKLNSVTHSFCSSGIQFVSLAGSSRLHEASRFHCWNWQTLGECLHHNCIDQIFYIHFLCIFSSTTWESCALELWIVHLFMHCCVQGHLHDRYGQLVSIYSKLLCTKMEFHAKVGRFSLSLVCLTTQGCVSL